MRPAISDRSRHADRAGSRPASNGQVHPRNPFSQRQPRDDGNRAFLFRNTRLRGKWLYFAENRPSREVKFARVSIFVDILGIGPHDPLSAWLQA